MKKILTAEKIGFTFFCIGLFLLPSALFLGIIFLITSLIISTIFNYKEYFKDSWNLPFFISGFLLFVSSLVHSLSTETVHQYEINSYFSWLGLANWIPFFWCFWGFKYYLNSLERRRLSSLILIAGSFPVFISGFGQYFFNWFGPMKTLFGSIIWFQRPILPREGMTGLFNNANYLAAWLNLIWPFCLASLVYARKSIYEK